MPSTGGSDACRPGDDDGLSDVDTLDVIAGTPDNFSVLAGDDAFAAPTVLVGGAGAIAAAGHVCTPLFVEMIDAARSGDSFRARRIAAELLPVVKAGFCEPSPAVWKAALAHNGEIASAALRRPMTAASDAATARLISAAEVARSEAARSEATRSENSALRETLA